MEKSESIKEIAAALGNAQASMSGAKKKSLNPYFKSNYANLEEVIQCAKEALVDNGLSFSQFPLADEGRAGVETILMHSSGEWISSILMLKCSKNDPQGMGSAITYSRRYALQAILGIPSEDNDGNRASANTNPAILPKPSMLNNPAVISAKQVTRLYTIAEGLSNNDAKKLLAENGFSSAKDITIDRYEDICNKITEKKKVVK